VESISFDGFTGPYCQYAYARIFGILGEGRPAGLSDKDADFSLLGNLEELLLLKMLIQFPEEVASGVSEYNPSRVPCTSSTPPSLHQFYNKHRSFRRTPKRSPPPPGLDQGTAVVLKRGLNLLGLTCWRTCEVETHENAHPHQNRRARLRRRRRV